MCATGAVVCRWKHANSGDVTEVTMLEEQTVAEVAPETLRPPPRHWCCLCQSKETGGGG